ncbi:hypothetical protein IV203_015763 [Nitzschia inconspicua]|uniref:Uncharacterized protein n=1 Tax=Nitzschia inconspicua TaxID=303405 RepID=A0A9K3PVY5_9STRA|nr:hypothetical protein IV203_015763 [Nitzschia inconspicua]
MELGDESTDKVGDGRLPTTMGASTANRKTLSTKEAVEATPGNASNSNTELEVSSVKAPSPTKGETASAVKTSDLAASSVAAETDSKQDPLESTTTTSLQPTSTVGTEPTTTKLPTTMSTKADENDSRSVPPQEETSSSAKNLHSSSTITSTTTAEKAEPTKLPSPKEVGMGPPTTSTTIAATTLKTPQTVTKSTVSLQKTSPSTDTSIEQPSKQSTTMDRNSLEAGSRTSVPVSNTTLSTATTPAGGAARPAANLNPEEAVKVMVNNIITLLETRGPLTMGQLEYNLQPLHTEKSPLFGMDVSSGSNDESGDGSIVNTAGSTGDAISDAPTDSKVVDDKSSSPLKGSDASAPRYKKLIAGNDVPDIVELLVALGVIQQEDIQTSISSGEGQKSADGSPQQGPREPRYAIAGGRPRQFVVTPSNVLAETAKAYDEIDASLKRQELLREALDPATSDKRAAQILEQIAMQYPQAVADDPVYLTALRNMHIDVVAVLGKHKSIQGTSGSAVTGGASGGGEKASMKKRVPNQQGRIQGTKRGREAGAVGGSKRPKKSNTLAVETNHKSVESGIDLEGKVASNVDHSETKTSVGETTKTSTAGIAIRETTPIVTTPSSNSATQSDPVGTASDNMKAAAN